METLESESQVPGLVVGAFTLLLTIALLIVAARL